MSDWVDVLADAAARKWQLRQALLLAQVPRELQGHGYDARRLQAGRSLRETIATEASEKVQLVRNPNLELVWGIIPKSASLPSNVASLFQRKTTEDSSGPRFRRWFWTAFIKPVPPGLKRIIQSDSFSDIPLSTSASPDATPVEESDVIKTQPDIPIDYSDVQNAISKWAERTGRTLEPFYASTLQTPGAPSRAVPRFPRLSDLGDEDLRRIMVPLDIVLKLMR